MIGTIRIKRTLDKNGNWLLANEYVLDGVVVSEKEFNKAFPEGEAGIDRVAEGKSRKRAWPIKSDGAAVHPKQRAEAIAHAKKVGVPTYFDRQGRAVFTSIRHQRDYLKQIQMHNRDDNAGGQSRTYNVPEPPPHPDL